LQKISFFMEKTALQTLCQTVSRRVKIAYRHLHAHPELSFCERETSDFIQKELLQMGIPFRSGIGGFGILAQIEGKAAGRSVALRADMDALPVKEATDLPFCSQNAGVMHACGHDAHVACLLGVADILNKTKNYWNGNVLLVFQPAEEKDPGGAHLMLEEGVFSQKSPQIILAQHVSIDYPVGTLAFGGGRIMASADEIHITIGGCGGHGALPHKINDTVLCAAQTLVALQQVRSRLCPPLTPMVLSFGRLIADGATNVIPSEVELHGTLRTLDENWRREAKKHIRRIAEDTAAAFGCSATVAMPEGYPCVDNDEKTAAQAARFAAELLGKENVAALETRLTAEDFGFFSQKYPACFYRFGVRGANNSESGELHSATFRIDEDGLYYGVLGMAHITLRFLEENS